MLRKRERERERPARSAGGDFLMHSCVFGCTWQAWAMLVKQVPEEKISSQKKLYKPSSTNLSQCLQIYVSCLWLALLIASGWPCFLLLVGLISCLWLALWAPRAQ